VLIELLHVRGVPAGIGSDNGPKFIAQALRRRLESASVKTLYIAPGAPWQNGYAESFHSRLRDELLNCELFIGVAEARHLATPWRLEYNHRRPHSSLGYVPPAAFAANPSPRLSLALVHESGAGHHAHNVIAQAWQFPIRFCPRSSIPIHST